MRLALIQQADYDLQNLFWRGKYVQPVRLFLESGDIYRGTVFAEGEEGFGELIFNTAMSGYEEVLTDPSYKDQFVLMTYPLIGNYGINEQNLQSNSLHLNALIVNEYIPFPSNWQSTRSLKDYLEANKTIGIEGIDTRHLTRKLRYAGALNALISTSNDDDATLIKQVKSYSGITGKNLAKTVSTTERYVFHDAGPNALRVAVIDCGVKTGILNHLKARNCSITVYPYNTDAQSLLAENYDGIHVSNGPGDPSAVTETIDLIKGVLGKVPLFGICLGHQMLCCATGFEMTKLPFGHHGINHPIKNLATDLVEISSQNHIYCATTRSIPPKFAISHLNLNDQTVAGIRSDALMAFSVQYHPEAAPGPEDSAYLFDDFVHLMTHKTFKHPLKETLTHA